MPDQLVSTVVTALLKIASAHPEHRSGAFDAIVALVTEIVNRFKSADRKLCRHIFLLDDVSRSCQHLMSLLDMHRPSTVCIER